MRQYALELCQTPRLEVRENVVRLKVVVQLGNPRRTWKSTSSRGLCKIRTPTDLTQKDTAMETGSWFFQLVLLRIPVSKSPPIIIQTPPSEFTSFQPPLIREEQIRAKHRCLSVQIYSLAGSRNTNPEEVWSVNWFVS